MPLHCGIYSIFCPRGTQGSSFWPNREGFPLAAPSIALRCTLIAFCLSSSLAFLSRPFIIFFLLLSPSSFHIYLFIHLFIYFLSTSPLRFLLYRYIDLSSSLSLSVSSYPSIYLFIHLYLSVCLFESVVLHLAHDHDQSNSASVCVCVKV